MKQDRRKNRPAAPKHPDPEILNVLDAEIEANHND